jgi:ubiquinone/menaquinone biosynthesis C-methylase UbiE
VKAYYHARAREYDDWSLGRGLYAQNVHPGWADERDRALEAVGALPPTRTLDVACGTGFVTRLLCGNVVGLDQSEAMLQLAREQAPRASFVRGDGLDLPFADAARATSTATWRKATGSASSRRRGGWRPSSSSATPPCTVAIRGSSGRSAC